MSSSSYLFKRKFDDFAAPLPIKPTRMRRDRTALPRSPAAADPLQFFVRILSGHTHVLRADSRDTVRSIHEKIQSVTGIPVFEQRLIYHGKQLNWEQTLSECGVQNDAGLHLVGRLRSTGYPQSWRLVNDVISLVLHLSKNDPPYITPMKTLNSMLLEFLTMTPWIDSDITSDHLQIFTASLAPAALVMLYTSSHKHNRDVADEAIKHFISSCKTFLPAHQCVPIIIEFCRLLRGASGIKDSLYRFCLTNLFATMEFGGNKEPVGLLDLYPFLRESASKVHRDLMRCGEPASFFTVPLTTDVNHFSTFVELTKNVIERDRELCVPIQVPLREEEHFEIKNLHGMFIDLLCKMYKCMGKLDDHLDQAEKRLVWLVKVGDQFLALLKVLNFISKLYQGCEEEFWKRMKRRKRALCYLIISSANGSDDHSWISECKKGTSFKARTQLAKLFIPRVKNGFNERHEMLINRANLLWDSFTYIVNANLKSLRSCMLIEFKNEEATGPGVLREWFLLVCQAIFNPQKRLFVACPNDHRRFFPRPDAIDSQVLKFFNFIGKVIALALMHKVQVGIMFDRIFFLQLGGHAITLEDIRDADPFLYNSCKQILEMDPEVVDQNALGLMFVHEIPDLARMRVVELCKDGKNTAVNSDNRRQYVESLIQQCYAEEISQQVEQFAVGFADIFGSRNLQRSFFRCLNLEDFNLMIHGSESEICVDDWKAHTKYNGFNDTDAQISWFWKIVGNMTQEQKKVLLFFWTSIKYLPVEGFSGLGSCLHIYKNSEPFDRLPSSHTCFYQLCFPAYPTMAAMRDCLCIITQEHVSCSFGTT